jgi:uroporphyrinogen decarboxylase
MTGKERFERILDHKPVDRVGLFEVYWEETAKAWASEGRFEKPDMIADHFGLDVRRTGGEITPMPWKVINLVADLDAGEMVVEENETARLIRDGNGALLRWLKKGSGAPEHVSFSVQNRRSWEQQILPRLLDESTYERRIDLKAYRELRAECARKSVFMACGALGAFDLMSPMCGHEHLLAGMALDPEWVRGMAMTYAETVVHLLEILFEREGLPDGLWVWDDLGFKAKPFMSPTMYRELLFPAHKRLFDFAHARGLKVVLHCDGYVEALLPHLIEAGINCLQPIEAKSGMDLVRLKKAYGNKIALIGGMDVRVLESGNRLLVDRELEEKLPAAMEGSGYVLQSDHSISSRVSYDIYRHFIERSLKIWAY